MLASEALTLYLEDMAQRECSPLTIAQREQELRLLFGDTSLQDLPRQMSALIDQRRKSLSYRSLCLHLVQARTFLRFCEDKGHLDAAGLAACLKAAKVRRQRVDADVKVHRVDDARTLYQHALAQPLDDKIATGVALALRHGLSSHEVLRRRVEDIDDNGRVLRILRGVKTSKRRRIVALAPELQPRLAALADGRPRRAALFRDVDTVKAYRTASNWLRLGYRRLCASCGVPHLDVQALRRSFGTLAARTGAADAAVGSLLGHGAGSRVTRQHYIAEDAAEQRDADAFGAVLSDQAVLRETEHVIDAEDLPN